MSIIQGNAHTSAGGGYQIERSLRFNSADTAYLNRTPATTSNQTTWTWSGWVKRGKLGVIQALFGTGSSTGTPTQHNIYFSGGDTLFFEYWNGSTNYYINSSQLFRDPSAWYHIVAVWDTTQGTSSNRMKLYVNGSQITALSGTVYPSSSFSGTVNTNVAHYIGAFSNTGKLDGYLTEINFIDGQALTPSDFGETDSNTGVWKPKAYTGTYGTNGFYLKFADNSGTTSTTLGKDSSGNGNNWTPNNFSVTAGAGNDSLVDSPTSYGTDTGVGGEVRGNYATLNPLNKNTSGTLSNGNLEWQASTTAVQVVTGTSTIIPSGKTYFEVNVVTAAGASNYYQLGIVPFGKSLTTDIGVSSGNGYAIEQNGNSDIRLRLNGSSVTVSTVVQTGDVLQVAVDYATGKLWFGRNNTWYNSSGGTTGNPGAGTNETATISTTTDWFPAVAKYNTGGSYAINFGQRAFAYTAPSGFKALCTQNLPTPTIGATSTTQANDYFNVVTYTGNATARSITGVGFQPDFVWIKNRTTAFGHLLYDVIRGTGLYLASNSTAADTSFTNGLTSFDSDGFGLGTASAVNENSSGLVAWNWKANGAGSSNTAGTITSTVSANTTAGFSIVTAAGQNNTSTLTIGHGLGVAPKMLIGKSRNGVGGWSVWHTALATNELVYLNSTAAKSVDGGTPPAAFTATSSTTFTVQNWNRMIGSGVDAVFYAFVEVAGYSAFGSYTGNGSTDGPFVYVGFRPRFVLIKDTSSGNWRIYDTARDSYNVSTAKLYPSSSVAENGVSGESASTNTLDVLSNGFKLRTSNSETNFSSNTYIYAAFGDAFKYSLAR